MPRQASRTRKDDLTDARAWVRSPSYIVVRGRILVHARRDKPGAPCECCGSRRAEIVSERAVTPLLIRTSDGTRWLRSEQRDVTAFDDLAERAHVVDLPMRVPDVEDVDRGVSPSDLLVDLSTVCHAVSGGNRSGKSTFGTDAWLPYRWILRGGKNRMFRVMGPQMSQAHILKAKLFVGEGDKPPAFPAELVTYVPEHERVQDQKVRLIDGTQIELTHAKQAGHLKGVSVVDTLWTETTECPHPEVYTVTVARHADTGGQLYLDSTPKKGHWMEEMVLGEEREAAEGERRQVRSMCMRSSDNPWVDPREIASARAAAYSVDPIMARREFDGEWIGGSALIFGDVWDPSKHVIDMPGGEDTPNLRAYGLVDVTRKASRKFFGGSSMHEWVCGVDVNRNPHTAVVCKIFVREGEDSGDPRNWGLLIYDEVRTWNTDAFGAAKALHKAWDGLYQGAGIAIDATSAHSNQHAAHTGGNSATTPVKDYKRFGFNCRPNRNPKTGKPWNPFVRDSTALVKQLMRDGRFLVNATKAPGTIKAIERQEDRGDGKPVKESNTVSDREIAAFTDSIRYLTWPIFSTGIYSKGVKFKTSKPDPFQHLR